MILVIEYDFLVIEYLLEIGANVDFRNTKKYSYGNNAESGPTALMAACKINNLEVIKLLLKKGANPNVFFTPDESLLMFVVRDKKKEIESLLIENGAKNENLLVSSKIDGKKFENLDKVLFNGPSDHSHGSIPKDLE